jgi:hypothetical protein
MITRMTIAILSFVVLFSAAAFRQSAAAPRSGPLYTDDAQLRFPEDYREWVYLSSGFDMAYTPSKQIDPHKFDNVFVNPEAYKAFVATGTWPNQTMLVLEIRVAEGNGSINQKDRARFRGQWAFFAFDNAKTSKMIPTTAACYSCHAAHGAVDTTFVQFYPTLLPIAKRKGTLAVGSKQ